MGPTSKGNEGRGKGRSQGKERAYRELNEMGKGG